MRKILTLILVLCSIVGFAQIRGGAQYDPGAARANLGNVDAAATPSMTSVTLSDKVRAAWADILGDIYASGTVKVATGAAAAPAYSFASDPNTGVYSPAADNLGVSVAGAEALRVNSAGEMLIATSTDAGAYKLQVNGNAYVNGNIELASINSIKYKALGVNSTTPTTGTSTIIINHSSPAMINYTITVSAHTSSATHSGVAVFHVGGYTGDNSQMMLSTINKQTTSGITISDLTRLDGERVSFTINNTVGFSRTISVICQGVANAFVITHQI